MIGQTISHYKILERLGGGGTGLACRVGDTRFALTVALMFPATSEVPKGWLRQTPSAEGIPLGGEVVLLGKGKNT